MFLRDNLLIPFWKDKNSKLICGFSLPTSGNLALTRKSLTSGKTTDQNRADLSKKLNIDYNCMFSPHQTHSDIVIDVDEQKKGMGALNLSNALEGDACVTDKKNILLLVTWADCVPVILFDVENSIVGAIHSGWRGTVSDIIEKTIRTMQNKGSKIQNIYASIGPAIRNCCYKVGNEFKTTHFSDNFYNEFFHQKEDGLYFDIAGVVYKKILSAGIKDENIDFYGKCNSCSKELDFFSCRKDGKDNFEGQAAFIGIFD